VIARFQGVTEAEQRDFRGQLSDYVRLYAFLAQVLSLPRKEQVSVLDRVLTPHLELEVSLKRWHSRTRSHDAREIARTVNRVASEVRRGRVSARRP
jgi:hypothetical protein